LGVLMKKIRNRIGDLAELKSPANAFNTCGADKPNAEIILGHIPTANRIHGLGHKNVRHNKKMG
jgi:hypothetical protein